jgi:hypothetical protein
MSLWRGQRDRQMSVMRVNKGCLSLKVCFFVWVVADVDVEEEKKLEDPFYKLEKGEEDKLKASEQHQQIMKLYDKSERNWSDPWTTSQKLRKTFREEKKVLKAKAKATEEIRSRSGLHIDLLPETEDDTVRAKLIEYDGQSAREAELRRRELKTGALVLGKRARDGQDKRKELERVVRINTRERTDPFLHGDAVRNGQTQLKGVVKVVKKQQTEQNGHAPVVGFAEGYSSESE